MDDSNFSLDYFPYSPRSDQREILSFISSSISNGKHVVIESGTGTGKTITSLSGTLPFAKENGLKIIYLTRTKSQQKQILSELKEIAKQKEIFGIGIQGRSPSTCPIMKEDNEFKNGTPDELSKLCSHLKKSKDGKCRCKYYQKMLDTDIEDYVRKLSLNFPEPEAFQKQCILDGYCPYEASKIAIPYADVVAAPYTFVVVPFILKKLLEWMNVPLERTIIVVDEAHNLPEFLRESSTLEYNMATLDAVEKEVESLKIVDTVANGIVVEDVVDAMRKTFSLALGEYLFDVDGLVPYGFLSESLLGELHVSSSTLNIICKNLIELGEIIKEQKKENMKLPRSHIGSLGYFIQTWLNFDEEHYVRLIAGGEKPYFQAYCMDPYEAASPFRDCYASIHMSGTLEPLHEYVAELGLENCATATFHSSFNPDNLLTLYAKDVTTRHKDLQLDPENIGRIKDYIIEIINGIGRNSAVFFPSYELMEKFVSIGTADEIEGNIYMEVRGMSQYDLMETVNSFRAESGASLFAVTGGRISEGLDFPSTDLEVALIVGLPYPRPSFKKEALIRYCDYRYGNGWNQVVKSPMVRKMRQARGRLIRSETDRGVAIILDSRISQIYNFNAIPSDMILQDCLDFFDDVVVPSDLFVRRHDSHI